MKVGRTKIETGTIVFVLGEKYQMLTDLRADAGEGV
jgi:hypothetical protein